MKKKKAAEKEDFYGPLEVMEGLSSLFAEDTSCAGLFGDSQRSALEVQKEESFLSHARKSSSGLQLPSMLRTTGGVIAPPRSARSAEVTVGEGVSLEQTPLDLSSSEETSSTPVKNNATESTWSSIKSCTSCKAVDEGMMEIVCLKNDHPPPSKKARKNCECSKATILSRTPRRQNLTKTALCHYEDRNNTCLKDMSLSQQTCSTSEKQSPYNDHCTYKDNSINAHSYKDKSSSSKQRDSQEEEWEESDRSRSPSLLPLTPGREDLESILNRKNLTLL